MMPGLLMAMQLSAQGAITVEPEFHHVTLPTGVTMRYVHQGLPGGDPVIFLHGYTDSWKSWQLVLDRLPGSIRAYALDLRGHGGSDRPKSNYSMQEMSADVVALIRVLGLRNVMLVGHSMGSLIAREVLRTLPDRVSRLVLIGSGPSGSLPAVAGLREELKGQSYQIDEEFVRAFQHSTVSRQVDSTFMVEMIDASLTVPPWVWRQALEGIVKFDDLTQLREISIPTLVVWGDQDQIFPISAQRQLIERLPRGELSIYRGVGHAPHWEVSHLVTLQLLRFLGADRDSHDEERQF